MKHGGPAPVRRFLPELINLVWNGNMNAGKVFDLYLPDQPRVLWGASDLRINFIVRWLTRRAKRIPYDLALRLVPSVGNNDTPSLPGAAFDTA